MSSSVFQEPVGGLTGLPLAVLLEAFFVLFGGTSVLSSEDCGFSETSVWFINRIGTVIWPP